MENSQIEPENELLQSRLSHLRRVVRQALKRCSGKLEKQRSELNQAENWLEFQQKADSLLPKIHEIPRGITSISLLNVHTGVPVDISLDPARSAHENAEEYFRKAKRGKRAVETIRENIQKTLNEISFLENKAAEIESVFSVFQEGRFEDAASAAGTFLENLIEAGYLPRASQGKEKPAPEDKFRKFIFDGKWTVLVGKNDTQNDELTLHVARPHDLWFHAYGSPGSHVVLRRDSKDEPVPQKVVEQTAMLAAWFSRQKHSGKVAVNYTEKRYVRKPRKSPPGLVMIEREKTLFVKPWNPHEA